MLTGQIVLREIARNAGREEVLRQGPDRAVNVEILERRKWAVQDAREPSIFAVAVASHPEGLAIEKKLLRTFAAEKSPSLPIAQSPVSPSYPSLLLVGR